MNNQEPQITAVDLRETKERATCPACIAKRPHTPEDWANHPGAGHGYTRETGYSSSLVTP